MEAKKILTDVDTLIENLENDLILLNEKCIEYVTKYDEYSQTSLCDGSLLKERMKTAVIQAVPNDV